MEGYSRLLVLATCLITVRLSNIHYYQSGHGEYSTWYSHSMYLVLPVSCKFENEVKIGDDLLQTPYWREKLKASGARGKDWSMVVVKKHFSPDLEDLE